MFERSFSLSLDEGYWEVVEKSYLEPEEKLAKAVVMQWMDDYVKVLKKKKSYWKKEDYLTYNWLDTEWAEFWCEVAEINIECLRDWAEKLKKDYQNKKRGKKICR